MNKIDRLGRVRFIVVPSSMHRLDAAVYKRRYPGATVMCPRKILEAVGQKVRVDAVVEDLTEMLAMRGVSFVYPEGVENGELAYKLAIDSSSFAESSQGNEGIALVFCDLLFNLDNSAGFMGWIFKLLGSTGFFGMTLIGKLFVLKDKEKFKFFLSKFISDQYQEGGKKVQAICVCHGKSITKNCGEALQSAIDRLG